MFRFFIEAHEAQSFNMFPWNEGLLIVYCEKTLVFAMKWMALSMLVPGKGKAYGVNKSRGLKEIHVVKCGGISRVSQE